VACRYLLYFGVLLHFLEIKIQKTALMLLFVMLHLYFHKDNLLSEVFFRNGTDHTAYVVQAGQFASG
jgi:hypothetical protein